MDTTYENKSRLKIIWGNLKYLLSKSLYIESAKTRELIRNEQCERIAQHHADETRHIFEYFQDRQDEASQFSEELEYLRETKRCDVFPYPRIKHTPTVVGEYDTEARLPYIIHNNKRLYFPSDWDVSQCINYYQYLLCTENIVGDKYTRHTPHQYQTEHFQVNNGDIVIDAGCAEALFALDVAERASHIYLLEYDQQWTIPLQHTFEPWKNKVTLIHLKLDYASTTDTISLSDIISQIPPSDCPIFIKMDIEGMERHVLQHTMSFLKNYSHQLKIACCTYHHHQDEIIIKEIFDNIGFYSEFSDGYMLFNMFNDMYPPFFRHGVIRASNRPFLA